MTPEQSAELKEELNSVSYFNSVQRHVLTAILDDITVQPTAPAIPRKLVEEAISLLQQYEMGSDYHQCGDKLRAALEAKP